MANFYWVGAATAAGISRYDFNTPANWQLAYWSTQATGPSFGWNFTSATAAPGAGDNVFVGVSNVGAIPQSLSPCLYGGYSGNSAFGAWMNSGPLGAAGSMTGTTATSALQSVSLDISTTKYPFPYFGGGLTGQVLAYAVSGLGITTGGDLTGPTAERAYKPMKLKVASAVDITTGPSKSVDVQTIKALSFVGSSNIVNTSAHIHGSGTVRMSGGHYSQIINYGPGYLSIDGLTCGTLVTIPQGLYVSPSARFGTVLVNGAYTSTAVPIYFGGSLETSSVLLDLGFTGSVTGSNASSSDSTITINPITNWWTGGGITAAPIFNLGSPGITSSMVTCQKVSVQSSLGMTGLDGSQLTAKWNLVIHGGLSASAVELDDAIIKSSPWVDASQQIKIGTLGMQRNAILDFASGGLFDNWQFGSITGSANNVTIAGGVVFRDESPIIKGSAGVRLFNTQVVLGNRFDARTGKITNVATDIVFEAPPI